MQLERAQNRKGGTVPTEYADISAQVLDLIVQAPVLLLNCLVVGHDRLTGQQLFLVVLASDLQTHVVLLYSLKLIDDEIVLLAFLFNLQGRPALSTLTPDAKHPGPHVHPH